MVGGNTSTATRGSKKIKYFATTPAPTLFIAIKRHNSNRVKMMKMETSERKAITKLTESVRSRLASRRLGKGQRPKRGVNTVFWPRATTLRPGSVGTLMIRPTHPEKRVRFTVRNPKLNNNISAVAIQVPAKGEIVPALASD